MEKLSSKQKSHWNKSGKGGGLLSGWTLYPFTPFFLARNSKYVCWDLVTKIVEGKKWLVLKFIKENVNLHWMIDDTYWCTVS